MAPDYGEDCQQLLLAATEMSHALGLEYVGTEALLVALLSDEALPGCAAGSGSTRG